MTKGDLFTASFWRDTAERIVSSAGQGFINGLGGGAVIDVAGHTDIRALPLWAAVFNAAGMALLTFAKCLAASRVGAKDDASLLRAPGA
jgi:hypothetical protein